MRTLKKAKLKPCSHLTPRENCPWCEEQLDNYVGKRISNGKLSLEDAFKLSFDQKLSLYEN